jgi:hypothetical protein
VTVTRGRVAVIGDIGGHAAELTRTLLALGAEPGTCALPDDLTVVQVGDLIHRGPDTPGVVRLVDRLMTDHPGRWVQLAGNHEAQYLTEVPRFVWREKLDRTTVRTVQDWWHDGRMQVAAAISGLTDDWLVTHAGLTRGYWSTVLAAPTAAPYAARALNGLIGSVHEPVLFHGGVLIDGTVSTTAGPLWAAAGDELVPSWQDLPAELPFSQLHGHSTVIDWQRDVWRAGPLIAAVAEIDVDRRHVSVPVGAHAVVGIDPCLGRDGGVRWAPFVLDGARVIR